MIHLSRRQRSAAIAAPRWCSTVMIWRDLLACVPPPPRATARPVSITLTTPLGAAAARKRASALISNINIHN